MSRNKKLLSIALILILILGLLSACGKGGGDENGTEEPGTETTIYTSFLEAVDVNFAYEVGVELAENPEYHDSPMGTRTAGSDAEHKAADYLANLMESIGLQDVEKVGVKVDRWQFNGASLVLESDGDGAGGGNSEKKEILLHSYATEATPKEGIDAEIIYVGEGTMADYEGLDVKGKIVLCDVNQRDNWWVTMPMLEAWHQGAAALLAASTEGFSEISDEAYNANDICGPTGIPCVSITPKDSAYLQSLMEEGPVRGNLKVDNIVEPGGTSYNIVGKIPGKSSEEMVIFGAHYDMYFTSFQDDSVAVGSALAIAKAMIDSGYTPERDIVFCIHGSEEWGASNSQFDWTTGAWRMINEAHPEWAGKTLAFINFELPAFEFDDYTMVYSAPEMYTMIDRFVNEEPSPGPVDCFPDGVLTDGFQTYTYSDDFSYYVAGVPSTVNGFLLDKDMEDVFPFYREIYHSNFDTKETCNFNVLRFTVEFYGAFGIYIDSTPALQLDYTAHYDRLMDAIDEETALAYGVDYDGYIAAAKAYKEAAEDAFGAVDALNKAYFALLSNGNGTGAGSGNGETADNSGDLESDLESIWAAARDMNKKNLALFKLTQDKILGLMYERPIVPHEAAQENLMLMQEIIALLKDGDVQTAVDEYAWQINNVEEWYAMYFSPEVTKIGYDMFYSPDNKHNLFWGSGKEYLPAEVEEATRSLVARYDEQGGKFAKEIAVYEASIEAQKIEYKKRVSQEIADLYTLTQALKGITY